MKGLVEKIGYCLGRLIGSGAHGSVWKAVRERDGRLVALKVVDVSRLGPTARDQLCQEVEIVASVRHPNIVQIYEVLRVGNLLILVMEYLPGGDLFDRLEKRVLKEPEATEIARQLISAVSYLHEQGIAHRDIKLENIVFATHPHENVQTVKLVDFGYAQRVLAEDVGTQICGSLHFMSPQIVQSQGYNPFKVDMWSTGIVLYTLITARFPFFGDTSAEVITMITQSCPTFSEAQWRECSRGFRGIVESLLSKPEKLRPSAQVVLRKVEKLQSCFERYASLMSVTNQWKKNHQLSRMQRIFL